MKIGAADITVYWAKKSGTQVGYARINGYHLDFWRFTIGPVGVYILRPRESDIEHPECHAGYRVDDREARHFGWPELPSYKRFY